MDTIHIEEGEHIILTVRKHWLILLRDSLGTLVVAVAPFVLFGMVSFAGFVPVVELANPYVVFATALWILLIWMTLAIIWTNYYLDIWILTDRRIFIIEQVGLFDRRVSTWGLERIQQITVEHQNVVEFMFGYGTLTVQTAGLSDHDLSTPGIPRPERVRTKILHQIGTIGRLEAMTKKQSEMIKTISHEAKGYLARDAAALAEIVEQPEGVPANVKKLAGSALGETRRGVSELMGILSGDAQQGEMTMERIRFDLVDTVRDAVELARPLAEAKGLALTVHAPSSLMFDGDPAKLRDVVIKNLIENAIHYTEKGSVTVSVSAHDGARISIADTGIGLSEDDRVKLFSEGGRGESARALNPHSTGFGLHIAKSIVEAHGGRIAALSDGRGKGSTFVVELPTLA